MTTHAIPRIPEWTIADRIRKARTSANLDLRELGDLLGLSHSAVHSWEAGHSNPHPLFLRELARICDVDPDWLIGDYVMPTRRTRATAPSATRRQGNRVNPCIPETAACAA